MEMVYRVVRVVKRDTPSEPKRRKTRRQDERKPRYIVWLLVFIASVIFIDNLVGDRGLLAMLRARQEYGELAGTIASQREENARLRSEIRRLKEDPRAIEEIARRDLGLIKAGEKLFIVKDVQSPTK